MQTYEVGDLVRLITECPENNKTLHAGQDGIIRKKYFTGKDRYREI